MTRNRHGGRLLEVLCAKVTDLEGDAAEVGVAEGDSAMLIQRALSCTVHLFDTWQGLPEEMWSEKDDHRYNKPGSFHCDLETCRDRLGEDHYRYYKGVIPSTFIPLKLKFVHCDVDYYLSTKATLIWAWKNLVPGGIVVCDDYKKKSTIGAKTAWDEFIEERGIEFESNARLVWAIK